MYRQMVLLLTVFSIFKAYKIQNDVKDQDLLAALKPSQNKKGRKFFLAAPKMVSFFTAAIFGTARKFSGPYYFVTALVQPIDPGL